MAKTSSSSNWEYKTFLLCFNTRDKNHIQVPCNTCNWWCHFFWLCFSPNTMLNFYMFLLLCLPFHCVKSVDKMKYKSVDLRSNMLQYFSLFLWFEYVCFVSDVLAVKTSHLVIAFFTSFPTSHTYSGSLIWLSD